MKNILLIGFFLISINLVAQRSNYLSSKNSFDVLTSINYPKYSGSFNNPEYKVRDGSIVEKKDLFDLGLRINFTHYFKKNVGFGLHFSTKSYQISIPSLFETNYSTLNENSYVVIKNLKAESMDYTNYYVGPRFEYAHKNGLNGIGLSYDVSFGYMRAQVQNRSYGYSVSLDDDTWSELDYYNSSFEWNVINGIYLQTGFLLSYPILDYVSLCSGFHYTFSAVFNPKDFGETSTNSEIFNSEDTFFKVQRENMVSFMFNLGLRFHL